MKLKKINVKIKKKVSTPIENIIVNSKIVGLPIQYGKPFPLINNFTSYINSLPIVAKEILKNCDVQSIKVNDSTILIRYISTEGIKYKMIVDSTSIGGKTGKTIVVKQGRDIIVESDFIPNTVYINLN